MRAIEATGKVDEQGRIQLDRPIEGATAQRVRVIVLLSELDTDSDIDDSMWREAAANNPAFAFLHDSEEDIYTLNDGKPVSYEG